VRRLRHFSPIETVQEGDRSASTVPEGQRRHAHQSECPARRSLARGGASNPHVPARMAQHISSAALFRQLTKSLRRRRRLQLQDEQAAGIPGAKINPAAPRIIATPPPGMEVAARAGPRLPRPRAPTVADSKRVACSGPPQSRPTLRHTKPLRPALTAAPKQDCPDESHRSAGLLSQHSRSASPINLSVMPIGQKAPSSARPRYKLVKHGLQQNFDAFAHAILSPLNSRPTLRSEVRLQRPRRREIHRRTPVPLKERRAGREPAGGAIRKDLSIKRSARSSA